MDVFVPAYREPFEVIERSLRAAVDMEHPHTTYLLDDGSRPELEELARDVGARYLTRPDNAGAKAGNINHGLRHSSGDIVVILDGDHTPVPEFLERSLGHFSDPEVGFVQVMLSFRNGGESSVARAAAELAEDFFNAMNLGMDALGACTHFGSNALIRRSALEDIGGYQEGLAEDLATSVELHAAGWRSALVTEPLAPGLVPSDLKAYFVQQFKWARGVFEELLTRYPRAFPDLTWPQRLAYLTRMTFYSAGLYTAIHFLVAWWLLFGPPHYHDIFAGYLVCYLPLMVMTFAVEAYAIRAWTGEWSVRLRGASMAFGTWPVYSLAALATLLRLRVPHLVTRKTTREGNFLHLVTPQIAAVLLTMAGVVYLMETVNLRPEVVGLVGFAAFMMAMHFSVARGVAEAFDPRA